MALLQNKEKAQLMGENGYKRVKANFNWAGQAEKIINLLK